MIFLLNSYSFFQFAITHDDGCDPSQHPCLLALPTIFLKAMKGLAAQVDAFLGENLFLFNFSQSYFILKVLYRTIIYTYMYYIYFYRN